MFNFRAPIFLWVLMLCGAIAPVSHAQDQKTSGNVTVYSPPDPVTIVPIMGASLENSSSETSSVMSSYTGPADSPVQNLDFQMSDDSTAIVFLQTELYRFRPTLLEDIGTAAQWASASWWNSGNIEARFQETLRQAYIRDGNFATSVSSPLAVQPKYYSLQSEIAFRHEMAQSLKHYMILRGIPKLLSSREETRAIGKRYEKTMQQVTTFATVKVETTQKWTFSSGINPLTLVGWISYSNPVWNFESNSNFGSGSLDMYVQRSFKRNYRGELRLRVQQKQLSTTINKQFNPLLKGYVSNTIPYADAAHIYENMVHSTGFELRF